MLISCTSCNSKYLVNSADLKPNGRNVKCAKCGSQWFQEKITLDNEEIISKTHANTESKKKNKNDESFFETPNLPSTYVKEQKVSILNSFLVILLLFTLIGFFWLSKKFEINNLVLLKFYIEEFYFNLNLIIDDIARVIYQIIN